MIFFISLLNVIDSVVDELITTIKGRVMSAEVASSFIRYRISKIKYDTFAVQNIIIFI